MTHTYLIDGMTCNGCAAKVKSELLKIPGVLSAEISLEEGKAAVSMQQHIPFAAMQQALAATGRYAIREEERDAHTAVGETVTETEEGTTTYRPLFVVFAAITSVSLAAALQGGTFNGMTWMNAFMAGFFLVFSLFKMLDLKGFASSYAMYDIIAGKVPAYGYVYPFLEFGLGLAYLTGFEPLLTNTATLVIMGLSSVGVVQSVLQRRKIRCACLGAVFNLPMSTITIVENAVMILMALVMLIKL